MEISRYGKLEAQGQAPPKVALCYDAMKTKKKNEKTQRRSAASSEEALLIGPRVAHLRKERGITQVELAQAFGVTQPIVSEYESGGIPLRADQVVTLAKILRLSADVLLGLKEQAPISSSADSRLARRLRDAQRLPRRDRDALLRTLDAFLERASPA
jgi:transcriptional regulator with XRE-family HTH domain